MDVVALDDHVAEVDADAEFHSTIGRQAGVALGFSPLHPHRTAHGIDHAVKLYQEPVAHGLDQPTVMPGDLRLEHLAQIGLKARARSFLVVLAEAAITRELGHHYRGEPAHHA